MAKKIISVITVFLFISQLAISQPSGGPGGGTGSTTSGPIDGGAVSLVAAIAGYGYKKMKAERSDTSLRTRR